MSTRTRIWLAGSAIVALALSLNLARSDAAGEDAAILKIAAALSKGEEATAKSAAKALANKIEEIEPVMDLFKLRSKGGLGIGKKGSIQPDGIELFLNKIGRDAPGQATVDKHAAALEEMAYRVAAIAEVAVHKPPKEKAKLWIGWAKDLRKAAPALAKAAQSKSPAEVQKAATLMTKACNNCHSEFK